MHQQESIPKNEMQDIFWHFEIHMDHPILAKRLDLVLINQKKRISHLIEFAVLSNHRMKIKERKKIDKFLYLDNELKLLWIMKMTGIQIVVEAGQKNLNNIRVPGRCKKFAKTKKELETLIQTESSTRI